MLGRLFGISIRIHFSWVFIFALVAWSLATSYFPDRWSESTRWTLGVIGSVVLFVSVLIHELSHSLVAMSRGHKVKSITLFFLGGISEIEEEAENPGEEFWIAVVGPLTSLGLALIFGIIYLIVRNGSEQLSRLTQYLTFVNITLGVFNLLPAFPLDGGRVLRSIVWRASGSLAKATAVAGTTGSLLGFGMIALGVFFAFTGSLITGLWLVFIGWFIQSAASSARQQQTLQTALSGQLVRDAMQTRFSTVPPGTSVQRLVTDHITKEFERAYIVGLGDAFYGLVTLSDVRKLPPEQWASKYVTEIMTKAPDVLTVRPDDPLEKALQGLITRGYHQLLVMDGGKPVGIVTRGDVLRVLEVAQLLPIDSRRQ